VHESFANDGCTFGCAIEVVENGLCCWMFADGSKDQKVGCVAVELWVVDAV
jgi:hypothetical protein